MLEDLFTKGVGSLGPRFTKPQKEVGLIFPIHLGWKFLGFPKAWGNQPTRVLLGQQGLKGFLGG